MTINEMAKRRCPLKGTLPEGFCAADNCMFAEERPCKDQPGDNWHCLIRRALLLLVYPFFVIEGGESIEKMIIKS